MLPKCNNHLCARQQCVPIAGRSIRDLDKMFVIVESIQERSGNVLVTVVSVLNVSTDAGDGEPAAWRSTRSCGKVC